MNNDLRNQFLWGWLVLRRHQIFFILSLAALRPYEKVRISVTSNRWNINYQPFLPTYTMIEIRFRDIYKIDHLSKMFTNDTSGKMNFDLFTFYRRRYPAVIITNKQKRKSEERERLNLLASFLCLLSHSTFLSYVEFYSNSPF